MVRIHESGYGGEKLTVDSYQNGLGYSVSFGEAGSPMRNIYLQGGDAARLRNDFDVMGCNEPEKPTRDIWLALLDPYL